MTPAGLSQPGRDDSGRLPFVRDSEMAGRVRSLDWSLTALGPVSGWPESLRTAVGICLNSRFPMFVWWGPERVNIYNDAYIALMGDKHPDGLGRPARQSWGEIWDIVGREADAVMSEGAATWNERVRLVVNRHGRAQEAWFTWSYSPIPDGTGIGGLFCAVTEDTGRVLAERERDRQAEERRLAEERAVSILESITDGYFALDREWRFVTLNHRAERVLGREPGELIGRVIWDVYPGVVGTEFERIYLEAADGRRGSATLFYPDHDRWYEAHAYSAPDGVSVYFRDVTERKAAEDELRRLAEENGENSRRFDQVLSSINDFAYTFDTDGRLTFANRPLLGLWGRTLEEVVGKNFFDLGYPADLAERLQRQIERVVRTGERIADEKEFTAPDGRTGVYEYTLMPVLGGGGAVEAVAGSTHEITELKRLATERERSVRDLKTERANLVRIIERAPAFICVLRGPDHVFEMANERYYQLVGRHELIGKSVRDALPEIEDQGFFDQLDRVFRTGRPVVATEAPVRVVRGGSTTERFVSFVYQALRDADGATSGVFVHGVDVTDLVRAREAARENETRYRTLFTTIDQGFFIAEIILDVAGRPADYRIIEANPAFTRLTGLSPMPGRTILELLPDLEMWWVQTYGHVALTGEPKRFENYADALGKWYEVYAFRVEDPSQRRVAVFFNDTTERRHAAEALRESETRFRNMADHSPVMMWVTEPGGSCSYLNHAWYEFTGQAPGRGEGFGWLEAVHPDDAPGARDEFIAAEAERRAFSLEFRLRRYDGVYRWAIDAAGPRYGEDGAWLGYIGSVNDVTDLEEARRVLEEHNSLLERTVRERTEELEASHRQLRLSERMAALGTLSAGLGHDMGNLLLPIRVRLESLASADLPDELRQDVEGIRTSAEYLRRLSSGLRLLSLDPERANRAENTELLAWWDEAGPVLRNVLPRGVSLASSLPDEPCWAGIPRPALTQVVFNLVQNAGDAMRAQGSGKVTISAECHPGGVRVRVRDDGPGMTPEVRARCMEPFFTTKTRDISTGLGLALVYGLVREAGGTVEIETELGAGTTFVLSLPGPAGETTRSRPGGETLTARVDIAHPRMRALAAGELRAAGVEIVGDDDARPTCLAVVDEISKAERCGPGVTVVLLGPARADPRVIAIGERPGVREIRGAVRRAAGLGEEQEGAGRG